MCSVPFVFDCYVESSFLLRKLDGAFHSCRVVHCKFSSLNWRWVAEMCGWNDSSLHACFAEDVATAKHRPTPTEKDEK